MFPVDFPVGGDEEYHEDIPGHIEWRRAQRVPRCAHQVPAQTPPHAPDGHRTHHQQAQGPAPHPGQKHVSSHQQFNLVDTSLIIQKRLTSATLHSTNG